LNYATPFRQFDNSLGLKIVLPQEHKR
jgi:hypothetical protein